MLTLMVICYLFAWLPYTTVSIAKVWEALMGNSEKLTELNGIYGYLPALLAKSSITYNPVIYVLFNTQVLGLKLVIILVTILKEAGH